MSTATVVGGGPAGLMAAEVLAAGGRRGHRLRPDAVAGAQAAPGGARGAQHHALRGPRGLPRAVRRVGRPARAVLGGVRPGGAARLVRRPGRADVRRVERARVPPVVPRDAARPGLAGAASPTSGSGSSGGTLDRLGGRRRLRLTGADGSTTEVASDVTVLALGGASWPRLGSDGGWVDPLAERGVVGRPAATRQRRGAGRGGAPCSPSGSRAPRSSTWR